MTTPRVYAHPSSHRRSLAALCGPLVAAALAALALLAVSPTDASAQNVPMDFSDADDQLINWPFNVVEFFVEDDGTNVWQHYRVSESPEHVYDTLLEMKRNQEQVDRFWIIGAGKAAEPRNFSFTINAGQSRYLVQVRPDAAGADLVIKSTPSSMRSAYFKRALYPYRLGDNLTVRCERYDHADE